MKNMQGLVIIILLVIIAVLSSIIYKDRNDGKTSEPIKQVNQQTTKDMSNEKNVSGLDIKVTQEGSGAVAENGSTVSVHYTGKLTDGTVFDSSIPRGEPISFELGSGMVIPGWEQGILGMKVGEKRVLTIAPELAYGPDGVTNRANGKTIIPGNATLVFDVELVAVK